MTPVTRISSKSSSTPAPNSSSTPALEKKGGASQARKSDSVVWYGGENADQDVCIRLVYDTIHNEVEYARTLMVHSSRLQTCSTYFGAALSQRWVPKRKRSPHEFTFHVHGDVLLYTDCFLRMYKPFMVGFKSVKYSLKLLPVATHLAYDDLMSSICLYLSACPWSDDDEMRIRNSVLSEDFPRSHAQDLLERLESRLTRDDLRPLMRRCMEWGMKSIRFINSSETSEASEALEESAVQARELLGHILWTARGQQRGLRTTTHTFEQEAVCAFNEEFKLLLVAANAEVEAADTMENNPGLLSTVETIYQVLDTLLDTGMAHEAVKWFAQYSSFPKLLGHAATSDLYDNDVISIVDRFIWIVLRIARELVKSDLSKRSVHVEDSVRDVLLLNWLPLLDWLHINAHEALGGMSDHYVWEYRQVKQGLFCIKPSSEELKEVIDKVLAPIIDFRHHVVL